MKKRNILFAAAGVAATCILFYACQKAFSGVVQAKPAIIASSTNVATGQTVSLSVTSVPLGTHNVWASSPVQHALFTAAGTGGAVNISFTKPGTYVVSCSFVSGVGADSLPVYDTTTVPHDSLTYYPPVYPPDSTGNPHDTLPSRHDSIPVYGPGDSTYTHGDTVYYHVDTTHHSGGDSTYQPADSTGHNSTGRTVISRVSIVIVVH